MSCEPCAAGSFRDLDDAYFTRPEMPLDAACLTCADYFGDEHLTTAALGSNASEQCACRTGYYAHGTRERDAPVDARLKCASCRPGSNCSSLGITLETLPLDPGYWRGAPTAVEVYECRLRDACLGGPLNASSGLSRCSEGHTGVLCDVCEPGYFMGNQRCNACISEERTANVLLVVIVFALVPLLIVACAICRARRRGRKRRAERAGRCNGRADRAAKRMVAAAAAPGSNGDSLPALPSLKKPVARKHTLSCVALPPRMSQHANRIRASSVFQKAEEAAVIATSEMPGELRARLAVKSKVVVSMIQILALLAPAFNIQWPSNYSLVVGSFGAVFNVNPLSMLGLECEFTYNWHGALLQTCLFPMSIVATLLIIRQTALRQCKKDPEAHMPTASAVDAPEGYADKEPILARFCATGVSALLLLVLPRTAAAIFAAFNCDAFDGGVDIYGRRIIKRMLHVDLSIDCTAERHRGMLVFSRVMIAFYPLGVPLVFAILLIRARKPIRNLIDEQRMRRESGHSPHSPPPPNASGATPTAGVPPRVALAREGSSRDSGSSRILALSASMRQEVRAYAWLKPVIDGYRPEFYWYELLECVRKLALVGLLIPVGQAIGDRGHSGIAQLVVGSLIAAALLCVLCAARPYQLATDNALAITCQASVFITLQLAMYLKLVQYKTSTDINEASLRRLDETYITGLVSSQRDVERAVGYGLITLAALPLVLCGVLSAYETPRAWKSAKQSHKREASKSRARAAAKHVMGMALGRCGSNPFNLVGSTGSFNLRGRSRNNTVSGVPTGVDLGAGTNIPNPGGRLDSGERQNATLLRGGRRGVSFSVGSVCTPQDARHVSIQQALSDAPNEPSTLRRNSSAGSEVGAAAVSPVGSDRNSAYRRAVASNTNSARLATSQI